MHSITYKRRIKPQVIHGLKNQYISREEVLVFSPTSTCVSELGKFTQGFQERTEQNHEINGAKYEYSSKARYVQ